MRRASLALLALLCAGSARSKSVEERLDPGTSLFLRGELGRAADYWSLERQLGADPRIDAVLADAYGLLGRRALAAGDWALAQASFSSAAVVAPRSPDWPRLAALAAAAERGETAPSESDMDVALERDLLFRRLLLSAPAKAVPPARAAVPAKVAAPPVKITPKGGTKRAVEEALRLYYAGDLAEARASLEQIVARDPGSEPAKRALAVVEAAITREAAQRRYEAALRLYYAGDAEGFTAGVRETLKIDPTHAKAREALERLTKAAKAAEGGPQGPGSER